MQFTTYKRWLRGFDLNESQNELNDIFTGAVWSDGNDYMHLEERGPKIYGMGDDFDFERDSKEAALAQLKKWGYHYIGAE